MRVPAANVSFQNGKTMIQGTQVQKSAEETPALIAVNGKLPEDASEHPAEAAVA